MAMISTTNFVWRLFRPTISAWLVAVLIPAMACGFGVEVGSNPGSGRAWRWDAAPRTLANGNERSLDGGLRYSLEGRSYAAFKNEFEWQGTMPTDAEFQEAVERAFGVWTAVDPGIGLGTDLMFVPDFSVTPTLDQDTTGAEIDIFGEPIGAGFHGFATIAALGPVDLRFTSGTLVEDTFVLTGSQIVINTNEARWNLNLFHETLTHEIGHILGLLDVEITGMNGEFIDDNFDSTNAETIQATLTNSFSALIDPMDPENSPGIAKYTMDPRLFDVGSSVGNANAPFLLMESAGDPNAPDVVTLDADSFAGRQYLYPSVPRSGDFNENGALDVADVNSLMEQIGSDGVEVRFDVNRDRAVDRDDLNLWVRTLKHTYFGDANLDGLFNSADIVIVLGAGEYEDTVSDNSNWATGDWNADGEFTTLDLVVALSDGGYEQGSRPAVVPEPAGLLLAAASAVALIRCRRAHVPRPF